MRELDAHFDAYEHLKGFPKEQEALYTLRKVASMVKPIMRKRMWKVHTLAEFYPDQANLLGLNVNRGQTIFVRLRYAGDRDSFLPFEAVLDTLLHELSHIVWGPHDQKFYDMWNELRAEADSLIAKGYTGEGFLSEGRRVGGKRVAIHEMRRLARQAAEKRRALRKGSGQKLGGAVPPPGSNIHIVMADKAAQRAATEKGCANQNRDAEKLAEEARRNGLRTSAEEDDANNLAIAIALSELEMEEREREQRINEEYENCLLAGLSWSPETGLQLLDCKQEHPPQPSKTAPPTPRTFDPSPMSRQSSVRTGRALSRLSVQDDIRRKPRQKSAPPPSTKQSQLDDSPLSVLTSSSFANQQPTSWICAGCTLVNPLSSFDCIACGGTKQLDQSKGWACPVCTLVNSTGRRKCDACGADNPAPPRNSFMLPVPIS